MAQLPAPSEFDSHTLAEFIESVLLVENVERIGTTEVLQRFPLGQRPSVTDLEFALSLIGKRSESLGDRYPYLVDGDESVVRSGKNSVYDFLVLMSLQDTPVRRLAEYHRSDPLFDEVVAEAFKGYLGEHSKAVVFGWPPRGDRPTTFVEAVSWVADSLEIPEGNLDRPTHYKDAGVDVIAWKPFKDGRTGFAIYLVQNTVQMAYASKPRDVEPGQWMEWIRFGTTPKVGFAIPFSVPSGDERWPDLNYSADVPMDRTRLVEWVADLDVALEERLRRFIEEQVLMIASDAGSDSPRPPRVPKRPRYRRGAHHDEGAR